MNVEKLLHMIRPREIRGKYDGPLGRLVIDSREVRKNDVFIALRGLTSDGHDYINEAVRRRASVIIAERIPGENNGAKSGKTASEAQGYDRAMILLVPDTRCIAGDLAQAFAGYPARTMKMTGITGTNGKTSVSTLVYQVLRNLGYNTGLLGTVETRIGERVTQSRLTTPDPVNLAATLREMSDNDTAFAIMEVSSHALEQQRVGGIRFDITAFTNISQDHLDYHRDMNSYIEAKKRLFAMLKPDAVAVVNRDDPASYRITEECDAEIWEFGFRNSKEFRILDEGPDGLVLDLDGTIVSTPLTGRYNAYNVAQAYLICLALGCTKNSVASALAGAPGAPGRLERVTSTVTPRSREQLAGKASGTDKQASAGTDPGYQAPSVFVDYAHTPDALENVLKALSKVRRQGETLHVVFGCGGDRDRAKRPQMGRIAEQYADVITLTSDNPRSEDPDAIIREIRKGITRNDRVYTEAKRRKAIRSAIRDADIRTIILIAGKGHETYQEIHGRRHKFDDRRIAEKALNEWVERRISKKGPNHDNPKKEVC